MSLVFIYNVTIPNGTKTRHGRGGQGKGGQGTGVEKGKGEGSEGAEGEGREARGGRERGGERLTHGEGMVGQGMCVITSQSAFFCLRNLRIKDTFNSPEMR